MREGDNLNKYLLQGFINAVANHSINLSIDKTF